MDPFRYALNDLRSDIHRYSGCLPQLLLHGPWNFRCEGIQNDNKWDFKLAIDLRRWSALPINVSIFSLRIKVKSVIGERSFVNEGTVMVGRNMADGVGLGTVTGRIDLDWDRKILLEASKVEMEIEMEIIDEFDHRQDLEYLL